MDKITEWMGRVMNEEKPPQKDNSNQSQKTVRPEQGRKNFRGHDKNRPPQHKQRGKPQPQQGNFHRGKPNQDQKKVPVLARAKPKPSPILRGKLKIIPLGGLNEVGKNMMALEYEDDIIIIDMGFEFPSEDLYGIDYVIPDVTYLEENKHRIRGVLITHGHLDHIGGIPYILPRLNFPPIYTMKLTCGLIEKKIEEFKIGKMTRLHAVKTGEAMRLGKFVITFIRVAHSVPDATALLIDTPIGKLFHTGDFKFDQEPAGFQEKEEIHLLENIGKQNILAMFSESTNSLSPGHTVSERVVGEALEAVIRDAKGRIIIASFSSIIGRVQQIIDSALKYNRKIFISGKSMRDNIDIAAKLGFLRFPPHAIQDIRKYKNVPDNETLILTTGSQGEAFSALTRIANGTHDNIKVKPGDSIAMSSNPIPGNERAINTVVNNLCMLGAKVIHNKIINDIHTSGHAKQDELVRMFQLIKPKYFIPVHGEYYMRQAHAQLINEKCGMPEDRIIMLQNGDVLLAEPNRVYKSDQKIETKYILIDGRGEGHVGSQVQVDREIMSQNGALIVLMYVNKKTHKIIKTPDVVSRGFIYMHETDEINNEIIHLAENAFKTIMKKNPGATRKDVKHYIKQSVDKYTHNKLERRPLIVPLIIEV